MTEHDYEYRHCGHEAPPADVELTAFAYGCGAADVNGVCSAVVLRMATGIGPLTIISRSEMSAENARALAAKLVDLADKVDNRIPVP